MLDEIRAKIRRKHYSISSEYAYVCWVTVYSVSRKGAPKDAWQKSHQRLLAPFTS